MSTEAASDNSIEKLGIDTIRALAMDVPQKADSGHPGTPMALAPVGWTIWSKFLRTDPKHADWPNRDRFVMSIGHASVLLYALLHLSGVEEIDATGTKTGKPAVSLDDLKEFRQLDSKTPGHPEYRMTTGVEATTGPLGQGCGNSVGMAIAERWMAARYNRPGYDLFDHDIYVLCGDGDMMEGVSGEVASLAGHLGLSHLCWIYDSNHISIEGRTELAFTEDVGERFAAYGWNVLRVADANDTHALTSALETFKVTNDKPTFIVVHSVIAPGSPLEGSEKAHGAPLGEENVLATKRKMGWPEQPTFLIPDGVPEALSTAVSERGSALRNTWADRYAGYCDEYREEAAELDQMFEGFLPDKWDADIPDFPADPKGMATRDSGSKVLNAIAGRMPWFVGGSADLTPSTKTDVKGAVSFQRDSYVGRNMHFGVREHGMGTVVNGMTLSGLRAYGATFLAFLDYMRPPVRLAAMMKLGSIFIYTHDSIGVGEDGPTHQPVEHLAMLRATPGLETFRPGDANEVAEAWRSIMRLENKPAALVLTRQAIPTLDRTKYAPASGVDRGAYILGDCKGQPQIILIGTGSELHLAVAAHEKLAADGIRSRVVSMPSWSRFEAQSDEYRDSVFPRAVKARVSIEAGSPFGWSRYVGPTGIAIGIERFGASAPVADLMTHYGITVERVIIAALAQLLDS